MQPSWWVQERGRVRLSTELAREAGCVLKPDHGSGNEPISAVRLCNITRRDPTTTRAQDLAAANRSGNDPIDASGSASLKISMSRASDMWVAVSRIEPATVLTSSLAFRNWSRRDVEIDVAVRMARLIPSGIVNDSSDTPQTSPGEFR